MNLHRFTPKRFLPFLFCLSLVFGAAGPIDFTPSAEAATSAEKRKLRKFKRDARKFKKQARMLRRQLARALLPDPAPPFIEMVTVGNPGNAPDSTTYGAVAETFQIGKYEVTNVQYAAFLNAVAAADPNGLFNASMESDARGGIRQFGTTPNFEYAAKAGMGDKPVNYVSFWDACRFCNWLHNGMPEGAQGGLTTELGAYDLTVPANLTNNTVTRLPGAKFFLPTEDQWYKAAYHQPAGAGGDADNYWLYPTGANDPDAPTVASVNAIGEITNGVGDDNIANYARGADWDSDDSGANEDGNVATVGSGGPGSASFYGACDMAGNVWEWNETIISSSFRGLRGGAWDFFENSLRSSSRSGGGPDVEGSIDGFRVASP